MISEKDRISWEGVFNDQTIKIDEERIKKNMELIMKEKGIESLILEMKCLNRFP